MNYGYKVYINGILFPVPPSSISTKIPNRNEVVTLINGGDYPVIKNQGLIEYQMELLLPAQKYYFSRANLSKVGYHKPQYYIDKLLALKKKGKSFTLRITRDNANMPTKLKSKLHQTKLTVTLEDMEILEDAEKYGTDIAVSLKFKQYKNQVAKKVYVVPNVDKGFEYKTYTIKNNNWKKVTKKENGKNKTTYKITGMTLAKLAASKNYGKGKIKGKKIYEINKALIEDSAKKAGFKSSHNGKYLVKGVKLYIPVPKSK